jgi:hypothetical protein
MILSCSRWQLGRLRLRYSTLQTTRYHHHKACPTTWLARQTSFVTPLQRLAPTRRLHTGPETIQVSKSHSASALLPVSCPGCGALTQWVEPDEPGFYTISRRSIKSFLRDASPQPARNDELESNLQDSEGQALTAEEPTEEIKDEDKTLESQSQPEGMRKLLHPHSSFLSLTFRFSE